jgi:predicted RNase H-like HicB family nuclease
MNVKKHIKVMFSLQGFSRPDDVAEGVVSYCPALKIYSHGQTADEAKENLIKTITLYVETCFERGILGQTLKNSGFVPHPSEESVPVQDIADEYIEIQEQKFETAFDIEVPLNLIAQAQTGAMQHA